MTAVATLRRAAPWREWARSWWVLLALIGWLNWTAFVYAGLRARHRRWLVYGAAYLALSTISVVLIALDPGNGSATWKGDAGAWIGIFSWGVSFVHALAIRREFLDRTAVLDDPALDAAEEHLLRIETARRIAAEDPVRARRLGIGRPDVRGAFDGGLIDLNNAPPETIARLPGISKTLARRIVALREEINGFSSLEDLGHVLDLPAATLDRLRERAVVLPR